MALLLNVLGERLIYKDIRTPRSPILTLTPPDFYLWGAQNPHEQLQLKEATII
jgi:hypothetical protein